AARRFRGAEVARGRVEPGPNVTRHVGSEPVQLVHPWKHLRDEPQPAQREERPPTERQVELDFVDFDAELAEPDGGATAHPLDGRSPTTPQNDAGIRSDPPKSVPSASAIMPVTSPAAPPPVEPPALRAGSHGLRVWPNTSLKVFPPAANSGQFVFPRITAPAS